MRETNELNLKHQYINNNPNENNNISQKMKYNQKETTKYYKNVDI